MTDKEIMKGIKRVFEIIDLIKDDDFNISVDIIYSDLSNDVHLAIRYRTCNEIAPGLYYSIRKDGITICSEPINYDSKWKLMENDSIMIMRNNGTTINSYKIYIEEKHCVLK
jgi:predicted glutamine amidotransferase